VFLITGRRLRVRRRGTSPSYIRIPFFINNSVSVSNT
jgi:hypothetical protein